MRSVFSDGGIQLASVEVTNALKVCEISKRITLLNFELLTHYEQRDTEFPSLIIENLYISNVIGSRYGEYLPHNNEYSISSVNRRKNDVILSAFQLVSRSSLIAQIDLLKTKEYQ